MNLRIGLLSVLSAVLLAPAVVMAQEVRLRYAHFMPATAWQNQVLFADWADSVHAASDGRIQVNIFPAQTLGRAQAGYDNARTGIAEIVWTVQGYTANRFPLSQIVELPGLFTTAEEGSCAFQKLYDSGALDAEYTETQVLFVHVHGPGHLHVRGRAVTQLDDLRGLKIRQPTAGIGRLLSELGAEPVGMPAPQIYESTQRGIIYGFLLPWEAVEGFRVHEVVDQHTEFGFYSLAFVATMNRAAYERLPDDLRQVIDDHSGLEWALIAGRGFDVADQSGRAVAERSGTLHRIDPADQAQWDAAAERATEAYLNELEARGLPARQTYAAFLDYVAECRE